jgi:peptidyl-prolyl cis-trans isomerase C
MYRKLIQASATAALVGVTAIAAAQDEGNKDGGSEVIARVNGDTITRAEAEAMVQQRGQGRQSLNSLNSQQRTQMVNRLVEMSLLANEARDKGIADRADIKAQLQVTERLTLARALIQNMRQEEGGISEEDVRAAYEDQYGDESGVDELRASHILVDEESKAKDLIKQLDEGADFAKLAKEHSSGPSGKKGGDLGWFAPGDMVNAFSEAASQLDKGEHTAEPVKTQYGFHIIKLEGKRSGEKPSFEDKRQELRQRLASERIQSKIDELRDNAEVEISEGWGQE